MAQITEERSLRFISTPEKWPLYPILPMKRMVPGKKDPELGVLVWPDTTTVILSNMLRLPKRREKLADLPQEVYDTVDSVLLAGWEID
jgi:hypothetical protein